MNYFRNSEIRDEQNTTAALNNSATSETTLERRLRVMAEHSPED